MFQLLISGGPAVCPGLIDAALRDPDAVIRTRAIGAVVADVDIEPRAAILERLVHDDPVPAIRRRSLAALAEHMPDRTAGLFPAVLLDRSASVRGLARYVVGTHHLPLVPRDVYIHGLAASLPRQLASAIDGVGETGTRADGDRVARFLRVERPRIRRVALRAIAKLDPERAVPSAIAALGDGVSSVRAAAVAVLSIHASRVDFEIVSPRVRSLADPQARKGALRLFMAAPKWVAPSLLLEILTDPDEGVRTAAVGLIERWLERFNRNQAQPTAAQLHRIGTLFDAVASLMPTETAQMLRFSIKAR
jgi:HEAT repeat protein